MPTDTVTCRQCGRAFEPSREAIKADSWRLCPTCQPQPSTETRCRECGRVLTGPSRSWCDRCLTGGGL
jgi:uncharacterized OB-fold protein